jgi:predicted cupin superfamily sugar epimerase
MTGKTYRLDADHRQLCVPAGAWQAARTEGEFAWVACAVAPGFDFADFRMIDAKDPEAAALAAAVPSGAGFL